MAEDEVPEDWGEVEKSKSQGSEFLKVKSGEKVLIRILSGPLAYSQLYIKKIGAEKETSLNLPHGTQLPGYKPRSQYAFEVLVLDGSNAGTNKVLNIGQKLAEQLADIKKAWGSLQKCDIVLSKTGEKLETKWQATPVPASGVNKDDLIPKFNLREKIVMAKPEDLSAIPPAPAGKNGNDSLNKPISSEQAKFISQLADQKELSLDSLIKMVERKFNKKELDALNTGEASQLIDVLKAL